MKWNVWETCWKTMVMSREYSIFSVPMSRMFSKNRWSPQFSSKKFPLKIVSLVTATNCKYSLMSMNFIDFFHCFFSVSLYVNPTIHKRVQYPNNSNTKKRIIAICSSWWFWFWIIDFFQFFFYARTQSGGKEWMNKLCWVNLWI